MQLKTITGIFLTFICFSVWGQTYNVSSPDQMIKVDVELNGSISYTVYVQDEQLIKPSIIGLHTNLFSTDNFKGVKPREPFFVSETDQLVWGVEKEVHSWYNQLSLVLNDSLELQFRAYDTGVAWRYVSSYNGDIVVYKEDANFNIDSNNTVYFPPVESFSTPFEPQFFPQAHHQIQDEAMAMTPLLYQSKSKRNILISEVDLFNYTGMFLNKTADGFKASFPPYPARESEMIWGRWRIIDHPVLSRKLVRKTEDYLAKSVANRTFPWRAILISENDAALTENNLISALAQKPSKGEYDWVKPGKVVWDWYNDWYLEDVGFKSGINTQTYKYMIDFAAKNGIEYINMDDGWSTLHNFDNNPRKLDMDEVLAYAKEKDVDVFLWFTWQALEKDLIKHLDRFHKMGVSGLKVDFFDRCDQVVVDFINTLAEECAKRKMLVNLHGAYKPTGINITYPNVVNVEGVLGLENNKFSENCTPVHNLTIPFIRNVVGPMDYTPGAMRFAPVEGYKCNWNNPKAMTTKAQQMAMYVVYHGGVQMLSDAATYYEKDEVALEFLSDVPVSWDESKTLEGKIGEYIIVARRKGDRWYLAGMTAMEDKTIDIPLDFLDDVNYSMKLINDGVKPAELLSKIKELNKSDDLKLTMKATGGFVAVFEVNKE